MARFEARGIEI